MFPDYLIIDFDSTFVTVESLDELAHIVLKDNRESTQRLETIRAITRAGIEGSIPFDESLSKRLKLLNINQKDIHAANIVLAKKVTPSFKRNKQFLMENAQNILIISGGFYEIAKQVANQPDSIISVTIVQDEKRPLFLFKVSKEYKDEAADISVINPL